jgi:hypothetical protein
MHFKCKVNLTKKFCRETYGEWRFSLFQFFARETLVSFLQFENPSWSTANPDQINVFEQHK